MTTAQLSAKIPHNSSPAAGYFLFSSLHSFLVFCFWRLLIHRMWGNISFCLSVLCLLTVALSLWVSASWTTLCLYLCLCLWIDEVN
ncbi:hypothetical protein CPB84DRAFT_1791412 [Gymnopilus junonius]|uniref:Uncharacterized protein n=1 Tax=Gymnopilus junonius TaxID=109634 RepID=A0A9P5TIZ8_GYMJU|nr:hypothetical protein CPB84DRAFT_1791412 [Gymnopilus junonius]